MLPVDFRTWRPYVERVKTCTKCKIEKDDDQFYKSRDAKDGLRSRCKDCLQELDRKRYQVNPQKRLAQQRRSAEKYPDRYRARRRKSRTNWLPEAFERAWAEQNGKCAICSVDMLTLGTSPVSVCADHCHVTGNPRALLCRFCNHGLGHFREQPETLRLAAQYLERFHA